VMEGHFEFTIRVAHTVKISACAWNWVVISI
jgi:hypothetical protein